jgi:hypothetical protein
MSFGEGITLRRRLGYSYPVFTREVPAYGRPLDSFGRSCP